MQLLGGTRIFLLALKFGANLSNETCHIPDDSTSNLRRYRRVNAEFQMKQLTCRFWPNLANFMCTDQ